MNTYTLSVTRDHSGRRNSLLMMQYSTAERLTFVINRAIQYAYIRTAYDEAVPSFISDIGDDIAHECEELLKHPVRETSNFEFVVADEINAYHLLDNIPEVVAFCQFMIGKRQFAPTNWESLDIVRCFGVGASRINFAKALVNYRTNLALVKAGEAPIQLRVEHLALPICLRQGFTVRFKWHSKFVGTYEYIAEVNEAHNIAKFVSCFAIPDATMDTYMAWLGHMCVEPNPVMTQRPLLSFARRSFNNPGAYEIISDLIHSQSMFDRNVSYQSTRTLIMVLTAVYHRYQLELGSMTSHILGEYERMAYLSDSQRKAIAYIKGVLVHDTTPADADTTQGSVEAFKESDWYVESMDITSKAFISFEAEEDPFAESDEDPLEDDEEDPEEDPEDPEEDPEENPEEPKAGGDGDDEDGDTNDATGITLTLPKDYNDLDEYLFRREVDYIISEILKYAPEGVSAEDMATLRRLQTHWLYLLSVESIHEIVTSLVKLPIQFNGKS